MKTIVVTSQKGGSGKSTLSAALAVQIERAGEGATVVIDADAQGTLSMWRTKRKAESPKATTPPNVQELRQHLDRVAKAGAAYVVIDTAPARHAENDIILAAADFVLIPMQASPADVWALKPLLEALRSSRTPFAFVMNRVKPNTRLTSQTIALLSKHGPVLQAFIADRTDYAAAMTDGRTAPEVSNQAAATEIAALWDELKELLSEIANSPISEKGGKLVTA